MDEIQYTLANSPPCARYEEGENDDRLTKVWIYVAGLVGGGANVEKLNEKIARLYDYKGDLIVATRNPLPAHAEALFRHAWEAVGRESEGRVEFLDVNSQRWEQLWGLRRFDSDWQP